MSNLFVVLLLTTLTGTIFYLIGIIFQKIWFKNDARLLRFQMQVTQCAFVVPFVYVILHLVRIKSLTAGGVNNLFYSTLAMRRLFAALGCIWMLLFLILLVYKVHRRMYWTEVFQGNIPEEDVKTAEMFEEICVKLGVSGKISLCRNDSVDVPCVTYAHGFVVVLPLQCYTETETAVILYHELCHYLSGDLYLKTVSCIVELLHVFNPAAHKMLDRMNFICEECCDRMACEKGAEAFSRKEYFLTILNALSDEGKRERYNLFLLADTKGDCERRVQSMKEYRKHGSFKRGTAVLLAACFLMGSSITALAAGEGVSEAYGTVAEATAAKAEDSINAGADIMETAVSMSDEELLEEFSRVYDLDPEDIVIMGEEGIEPIGDSIYIDWYVPKGKTYMTGNFHEDDGGKILAMTSGDPSSLKYQMGVKDPNDLMRYTEGSGDMAHSFYVSITGGYCFFVTNLGSEELHVKGSVIK